MLLRLGRVDEAVLELRKNVERRPRFPPSPRLLGIVHLRRGEWDAAIRMFERKLELKEDDATVHFHLGYLLLGADRQDDARRHLLRYHDLCTWPEHSSYPRAEWERDIESLIGLAEVLPREVGAPLPDLSPREMLLYAELVYDLAWFETSARAFAAAFEADPDLATALGPIPAPWRNQAWAALAAWFAAEGRGLDAASLDTAARESWREQAYGWLSRDVALWEEALSRGERAAVRDGLDALLGDIDSWTLVEPEALADLPERWRDAWGELWAKARAIRKRAQD
jgi:tetratricopeptide (TPR) repeat protein